MNFKNKITLIIILILFLIIGLLSYFFYFQNNNSLSEEKKIEIILECSKEFNDMDDGQFVEKISKLDLSEEETLDIKKNMIEYLGCRLNREREEFNKYIYAELANRTLQLIERLDISDELMVIANKNVPILKMFYQNNGETLLDGKDTINNDVALSPIETICSGDEESDYFLGICPSALLTEGRDKLSLEEIEIVESSCNNFCESFNRYTNNQSDFEADMSNLIWPKDDLIKRKRFIIISAFAFKVGGEELALKFCDFIKDESLEGYEECKSYINSLKYINCKDFGFNENKDCILNKYDKCDSLRKKTIDSVCSLTVY